MATRTYGRPTLPWPLRLLGWLFRGALILFMMAATAVAVVAIASSAYYELTRTTSGDVEKIIEQRLPSGSSAQDIYAVLDEEGIEHGTVEPFPADDLKLLYEGVEQGMPVVRASVTNDGYSLQLVDVRIAFVMNESGMLAHAMVYERHYSPEWLDDALPK